MIDVSSPFFIREQREDYLFETRKGEKFQACAAAYAMIVKE